MLADGVAAVGRSLEPVGGFGEIARRALSVVIHSGKIGLGDGVVLAGSR